MAGAPKGNKNAIKLRDSEIKKEAYKQYCAHLALGKDKKSWTFMHPTDPLQSLTYKTMDKYIAQDPIEFPPILIQTAQAKSFEVFEELGMKLIKGQIRNGSPETWKTFMRNKFAWDRDELKEVAECAADKILDAINGRNKS